MGGMNEGERVTAGDFDRLGGRGICRTCLLPIWHEVGEIGHREAKGWSDRVKRGGDSLVCFSAANYRHRPLTGREAAIYDRAFRRGVDDTRNTPPEAVQ